MDPLVSGGVSGVAARVLNLGRRPLLYIYQYISYPGLFNH
jgi:hypothetical protein